MPNNLMPPRHLWILALAATIGLLAVAVFRPPSLGPGGSNANRNDLASGEMAAFSWSKSPIDFDNVSFKNEAGDAVSLVDFKGKVTLLNLWATWCAPCLEEMPTLDQLENDLGSEAFQVIALAVDTKGAKAARETFEKLNIENLALYIDATAKATRPLRVKGMPTTILLNANAQEIGRLEGPANWNGAQAKKLISALIGAQ